MEKRVPARLGAIVLAFAALTVISLALTAPGSFGANEGGGGGGTPPPYPGLTECADAVGVISLGRTIFYGRVACRGARASRFFGYYPGCPDIYRAGVYQSGITNESGDTTLWLSSPYCNDGLFHWSVLLGTTTAYRKGFLYSRAGPPIGTTWEITLFR